MTAVAVFEANASGWILCNLAQLNTGQQIGIFHCNLLPICFSTCHSEQNGRSLDHCPIMHRKWLCTHYKLGNLPQWQKSEETTKRFSGRIRYLLRSFPNFASLSEFSEPTRIGTIVNWSFLLQKGEKEGKKILPSQSKLLLHKKDRR